MMLQFALGLGIVCIIVAVVMMTVAFSLPPKASPLTTTLITASPHGYRVGDALQIGGEWCRVAEVPGPCKAVLESDAP